MGAERRSGVADVDVADAPRARARERESASAPAEKTTLRNEAWTCCQPRRRGNKRSRATTVAATSSADGDGDAGLAVGDTDRQVGSGHAASNEKSPR